VAAEAPAPRAHAVTAIELHANARANFDVKAEALLGRLVSAPAEPEADATDRRAPSEQVVTRLPPDARQSETPVFRDGEGTIVARAFIHDGQVVGLQVDGYRALRTLAEAMQKTDALRPLVTVGTLEALIFEWVHARFTGRIHQPMSDAVLERLATRVAAFEVVVPLFRVELPEPITIGRVTLRVITSADFTRWESATAAVAKDPESAARRTQLFFAERKRMQGFAAATLTVVGESDRVVQVALEEADEAAALLRLFSPAMLSPRARSFCAPWGRQNIEAPAYLLFEPDAAHLLFGQHVEISHDIIWRLDTARVRLIRQQALDALAERLFTGNRSGFADEVRAAILLYSQTALRGTPTDKVLAVVLPLEAFLRRNATENITENFALRLALAVGETRDERRRIAAVAKAAYELRSRYVHHGKTITSHEDLETLRQFMQIAWRFFIALGLKVLPGYSDRAAYLAALDDQRFGADS
jgi:hypothetical protein